MEPERVIVPRKRKHPTTHCTECGIELSAATTTRRTDSTTWRSPCTACRGVKGRARHDAREEARRFMVTRDVCDICLQPEHRTRGGVVKLLAIDHDHRTGVNRGLLCQRCNMAIGLFADNVHLLAAAIRYLEDPPGVLLLEAE